MVLMEDKACLDSDFIISYLKGNKDALIWVKENSNIELATTTINVFELYYGEYKNRTLDEVSVLDYFLNDITILDINLKIAKKAGENAAMLEKEGRMLEFKDILIGTASVYYGYPLKTNNIKYLQRIPDIKLI